MRRWVIAAAATTLAGGLLVVSPTLAGQPPEPPPEERVPVETGEPPVTVPDPRVPDGPGDPSYVPERVPDSDVSGKDDQVNEIAGPAEGDSPVNGQGIGDGRQDTGGVDGQDGGGRTDG